MTIRHLRGFGLPLADVPAATGRMMRVDEIEALRYQKGGFFIGLAPVATEDDWPLVSALMDTHERLKVIADRDPYRLEPFLDACIEAVQALSTTGDKPVGLPASEDRHTTIFAGTRGGKGVSFIVPQLCLYPGSVVCIDPKGENAEITAASRGAGSENCSGLGQDVIVFDPYEQADIDPAYRKSWNFLTLVVRDDPLVIETASSVAEALILPSQSAENRHFDDNARILLKALILYAAIYCDRRIATLYRLSMEGLAPDEMEEAPEGEEPYDPFLSLLTTMAGATAESDHPVDAVIAGSARTVLDMGEKERGSVLSTMRGNLEFLQRPAMRAVLEDSDFEPGHLKSSERGVSVYLVLPPQRMADTAGWLRLMISVFLDTLYADRSLPASGHPVLFMLDEFAVLRRFRPIEQAAGYGAGFHLRLCLVLQDLPQLQSIYPQGAWETFLGNSGCVIAFDVGDNTTAKYLSEMSGQTHIAPVLSASSENTSFGASGISDYQRMSQMLMQGSLFRTGAAAAAGLFDDQSPSFSQTRSATQTPSPQVVPVLQPDEIRRLFGREQRAALVLRKGHYPMDIARVRYFEHPLFRGFFDGRSAADPRDAALAFARDVRERAEAMLVEFGMTPESRSSDPAGAS